MGSLGLTKTVVLGTGNSYGTGIIEPFWGGMGRADSEKNVELLKSFKQRKCITFDMLVLRSRKWIRGHSGSRGTNLMASAGIMIRDEMAGQITVTEMGCG